MELHGRDWRIQKTIRGEMDWLVGLKEDTVRSSQSVEVLPYREGGGQIVQTVQTMEYKQISFSPDC